MTEEAGETLKRAAQKEAATRPVIGGTGESDRQRKLNAEVGISTTADAAKEKLDKGKINVDQFNEEAGVDR